MRGVAISTTANSGLQNHWSFVLSHWVPDRLYLIGSDDYGMLRTFPSAVLIEDATGIEGPITLLTPKLARFHPGELSLYQFTHPEDTTYMFGPDNSHLSEVELGGAVPQQRVYIPTDTHHELYSHVAAAVVLAHREAQRG